MLNYTTMLSVSTDELVQTHRQHMQNWRLHRGCSNAEDFIEFFTSDDAAVVQSLSDTTGAQYTCRSSFCSNPRCPQPCTLCDPNAELEFGASLWQTVCRELVFFFFFFFIFLGGAPSRWCGLCKTAARSNSGTLNYAAPAWANPNSMLHKIQPSTSRH